MDEDDLGEIIVCSGPPGCFLSGDAAIDAQKGGCVWCRRIVVHADGSETETGPGHA